MLANSSDACPQSGSLNKDVHLQATSLYELINFITDELPRWRDRSDRKKESSETYLTSQLCAHLNSAARRSNGWDFLQFRPEEPDEQARGRKLDLAVAACDSTIWIEGRRHVDFDTLLPIECKRLPTPASKDRDEREYVISRKSTTGGIQRFKAGHHGAAHKLGAMIGYVQEETRALWNTRILQWITELAKSGELGWTSEDILKKERDNEALRLSVFRSSHVRENDLPPIELRHLWIELN